MFLVGHLATPKNHERKKAFGRCSFCCAKTLMQGQPARSVQAGASAAHPCISRLLPRGLQPQTSKLVLLHTVTASLTVAVSVLVAASLCKLQSAATSPAATQVMLTLRTRSDTHSRARSSHFSYTAFLMFACGAQEDACAQSQCITINEGN